MAKDFYKELTDIIRPAPADVANTNINLAANQDIETPDQLGKSFDISARTGRSIEEIRHASEMRQLQAQRDSIETTIRSNAQMADWFAQNPQNALMSYDDIDKMTELQIGSERAKNARGVPITLGERVLATMASPVIGIRLGIGQMSSSIYGTIQFGSELVGADGVAEWAAENALIGREFNETFLATEDGGRPSDFDQAQQTMARFREARASLDLGIPFTDIGFNLGVDDIFAAGVSLAPTLAVGKLTDGLSISMQLLAMSGTAGMQSFGSEFSQSRFENQTFGEAALDASISGAITAVLTRAFGAGGTEGAILRLNELLRGSANPREILRSELVRTVGKAAFSEFMEEGLDEGLQVLLVEEGPIDGDKLKRAISAMLKGGTLGGILGGGSSLAVNLANTRIVQIDRAKEFREENVELANTFDATKTGTRSQEQSALFMQEAGGLRQEVYLDGDAALDIMQNNPEAAQQFENMGVTAESINQAVESGSMIPLDRARVITNTNGVVRDAVINQMRESATSPTADEARNIDLARESQLAKGEEAEARTGRLEMQKQIARLSGEIVKAKKITNDLAMAELEPLIRGSFALHQRFPDTFTTPGSLLQKVRFQSTEFVVPRGTSDQIQQLEQGEIARVQRRGIEPATVPALEALGVQIDGPTIKAFRDRGDSSTSLTNRGENDKEIDLPLEQIVSVGPDGILETRFTSPIDQEVASVRNFSGFEQAFNANDQPLASPEAVDVAERVGIDDAIAEKLKKEQDTKKANDKLEASEVTLDGQVYRLEEKTERKAWAKLVDAPESIPEDHATYFVVSDADEIVDISLIDSEVREESAVNAAKFMMAVADGKLGKRLPIQVKRLPNGKFEALDGNSTVQAAKTYGWKQIPIVIAEEAQVGAPVVTKGMKKTKTKVTEQLLFSDQFVDGFKPSEEAWSAAFDEIYAIAPELQDELNAFVEEVSNETGAETPGRTVDIKLRATSEGKIKRKGYTNPGQFTDIVRNGFLVDSPAQADAVVKAMAERFELIDEGWNTTPVAYFDRKLLVRMDNGFIVEIQIWQPDLHAAKENAGAGHKFYDIQRLATMGSFEFVLNSIAMQELYTSVALAIDEKWKSVVEFDKLIIPGGGTPILASNVQAARERFDLDESTMKILEDQLDQATILGSGPNVDLKSATLSRLPESNISAADTSTQSPPGSNIATDSTSPTTAGLPSQSKNATSAITPPSEITIDEGATKSRVFQEWFGDSVVTTPAGKPMVVFRGEHANVDETGQQINTRLGSISFGSLNAANAYSTVPNRQDDTAEAPRTIPAYLSIQKPVINTPEDPFIDLSVILKILGPEHAATIAVELSDAIEDTNNWEENFADKYESVEDLLSKDRAAINDLAVDAFRVFDDAKYVNWFKEAGFDGAVHGGTGDNALEPEFKIFSPDQVIPVFAADASPAGVEGMRLLGLNELGDTFESRQEYFQTAYNGTPNEFERFSLDAINSGEGNQDKGWGLYFSSLQAVAENYAKSVADAHGKAGEGKVKRVEIPESSDLLQTDKSFADQPDKVKKAIGPILRDILSARTEDSLGGITKDGAVWRVRSDGFAAFEGPEFATKEAALDWLAENATGTMIYEALKSYVNEDFRRDSGEMWRLRRKAMNTNGNFFIKNTRGNLTIEEIRKLIDVTDRVDGDTGETGALTTEAAKAASQLLDSLGIPGLEYPSGLTGPDAVPDVRHFVIWNEDVIEVTDQNVLASRPEAQLFQSADSTPRGSLKITKEGYVISLFQNADLSTVLHETGHIFLEEMLSIVSTDSANEAARADWDSIANWQSENITQHKEYLRKELAKTTLTPERRDQLSKALDFFDNASESEVKDTALQFGHNLPDGTAIGVAESLHELWARGFEAYLLEGKAPSLELEKPFSRFRRWLSRIYKSVVQLNANVTEEIRDVFNRMLATDVEIQALTAVNELTFRSREEMERIPGVGPAKRTRFNDKLLELRERAADNLYKERVRRANVLRKQLRPVVTEEVMARKVYTAWTEIEDAGGLRHIQIQSNYGQDTVNALRNKGLISKLADAGAIPDAVANRNGYADADDMIVELLDARAPTREIKLTIDNAIIDSEIKTPSMDAVINSPEFDEAVELMNQYLSDAVRGTQSQVSRKALKRKAETDMSDMILRDAVRSDRFEGSVQRALKAERRAVAGDQFADALAFNEEARIQSAMAKNARAIRDSRDKTILASRKLPGIDKSKIEYAYYYHVNRLAARFGLLPANDFLPPPTTDLTLSELMVTTAVDDEINAMPDYGSWLLQGDVSPRLAELDHAAQRSVRESRTPPKRYHMLKVWEFEELQRLMDFLVKKGRLLKNDTINQGKERLGALVEESLNEMSVVKDRMRLDKNGIPVIDRNNFIAKMMDKVNKGLWAPLKTVAPMLRTLDGFNGPRFKDFDEAKPMARSVQIPLEIANKRREVLNREIIKALDPHLKVLHGAVTRMGTNVDTGVPISRTMAEADMKFWDGQRVLSVALNMGNEYNAKAMAQGFRWLKQETQPDGSVRMVPDTANGVRMLELFTSTELDAIQGVWDTLNTLWAESRAVHEKLYGFPPGKVEGDELTVTASDGEQKTLAGGYYPLRGDPKDKGSTTAQLDDLAALKEIFGGSFAPPTAKRNHLIARNNFGDKLILLDASRVLNDHLDMTITLISHGEWLRDTRRIFTNPAWRRGARLKLGDAAYTQLNGWLRAIVGRERMNLNWFDNAVQWTKAKTSVFYLAFKAKGIVTTADAIPRLMGDIGFWNYLRGVGSLINGDGWKRFKFMLDESTFMRNRLKGGWDREAKDLIKGAIDLDQFAAFANAKKKGTEWALAPYAIPSLIYEWPAWNFTYQETLEKTGDHDTAVAKADLAIKSSQPSAGISDRSEITRDRKSVATIGTMFSTWAHTALNSNRFAARALLEGEMSPSEYLSYSFFTNLMPAALFAGVATAMGVIFSKLGDEDDEEIAKSMGENFLRNLVTDQLRGIPFAADLAEPLLRELSQEDPSMKRAMSRATSSSRMAPAVAAKIAGRGIEGMYDIFASNDEEEQRQAIWNIAHMISYFSGIPASKAAEQMTIAYDTLNKE